MQIFNIQLNGDDAKFFCNQTIPFKIDWIKNHTNQQNDDLIMEWIKNPSKDVDCGCGCGGHKETKEVRNSLLRKNKRNR